MSASLSPLEHSFDIDARRRRAKESECRSKSLIPCALRLGTAGGVVTPTTSACTIGTQPASNSAFPTQITQMMDIVTHAFACDVTRVMTLQLSYAFSHDSVNEGNGTLLDNRSSWIS